MIEVTIDSIRVSLMSQHRVVILKESESDRYLPIWIGACEADVRRALGARATAARSQPYYLDVTHQDANKGFVLGYLSRVLEIPASEIATIGDQPNDVLMFKRSGLSIAMGNASEEVQRQASVVTDSYDNEGFAKAVERFLLHE